MCMDEWNSNLNGLAKKERDMRRINLNKKKEINS